jgi:hypothetical protein
MVAIMAGSRRQVGNGLRHSARVRREAFQAFRHML